MKNCQEKFLNNVTVEKNTIARESDYTYLCGNKCIRTYVTDDEQDANTSQRLREKVNIAIENYCKNQPCFL